MLKPNSQLEPLFTRTELKEHEIVMIDLIKNDHPDFSGEVLDIGCAAGVFTKHFANVYPDARIVGLDSSSELIDIAAKDAPDNVDFVVTNAKTYEPSKPLDIIIASGFFSLFDDPAIPLRQWHSWLKRSGSTIYIFETMNPKPIDIRISLRNRFLDNAEWESGYSVHSIASIEETLNQLDVQYTFTPFEIGIDLPEQDNPIRTFTLKQTNNKRMIINGANVVHEYFYLSIERI